MASLKVDLIYIFGVLMSHTKDMFQLVAATMGTTKSFWVSVEVPSTKVSDSNTQRDSYRDRVTF